MTPHPSLVPPAGTRRTWDLGDRDNLTTQGLRQTDLQGRRLEDDCYGNTLGPRRDGTFRVAYWNVMNLPSFKEHYRSRKIIDTIVTKEVDTMCFGEVGLYWPNVDANSQWRHRVDLDFTANRSIMAYNIHEKVTRPNNQLWGGTGILTTDEFTPQICDKGRDATGLGRWAWQRFRGKDDTTVRIISAYRPCTNPNPSSVWSQHNRHLNKTDGPHRDPIDAFFQDLSQAIQRWTDDDNDQIVLCLDANEDVRKGRILHLSQSCGLTEAILHHNRGTNPPATQNRNQTRTPIDGIFISPGLSVIAAGYCPFQPEVSDHRMLWVDLQMYSILGYNKPPMVPPKLRRLNSKNPPARRKYIERTKKNLFQQKQLDQRLETVEARARVEGWSQSLEHEYNQISALNISFRHNDAERRCRRTPVGGVAFSDTLQILRDKIYLWTLLSKRFTKKISSTTIRRLLARDELKPHLPDVYSLTLPQCLQELQEARTAYKTSKKDAIPLRRNFLERLAESRAEQYGTTVEAERKKVINEKKLADQHHNVKRMRGRLNRSATTMVQVAETITRPEGHTDTVIHTLTDRREMERACMSENKSRFNQTIHTPPMTEPLVSEFGYLADTPQAEQVLNGTYLPPPATDPYAALLLQELRQPASITPQSTDLSTKTHVQGWTVQKENTSAEPSSLHFSTLR